VGHKECIHTFDGKTWKMFTLKTEREPRGSWRDVRAIYGRNWFWIMPNGGLWY